MAIQKTGLRLLLAAAAIMGCTVSVLSATGPAIQYSEVAAIAAQARA